MCGAVPAPLTRSSLSLDDSACSVCAVPALVSSLKVFLMILRVSVKWTVSHITGSSSTCSN